MALTINRIAGTGYSTGTAMDDCVLQVFSDVGSWINCSCSIDVQMTLSDLGGSVVGSSSGHNVLVDTDYATIKGQLQGLSDSATNNIKAGSVALLPGSDPSSFSGYKRRVFWNAIITNTDYHTQSGFYDHIDLNSNAAITYDTDLHGTSCAVGKFGLYQLVLHELRELLGGNSFLSGSKTSPLDLFSWSAAGTRCFTQANRYFSWDEGTTNLTAYDASGGDYHDWSASGSITGAGYVGTSTHSPFTTSGASGDPCLIRYIDGQNMAVILPLTVQGLIVAGYPTNTVAPVISGTAVNGQTLSVAAGTWSGQATITKTYQWKRDGSSIGGATSSTYVLTGTDVGTNITCVETATNAIGAPTATSNSLGPITGTAKHFAMFMAHR